MTGFPVLSRNDLRNIWHLRQTLKRFMTRVVKLTVSVVLKMIWPYFKMRVGKHISRQRINRLMKAEGIVYKTRRRFKATTKSRHNKPVADNKLDRDFQREQLNQAYVGDITYVS